MVDNESSAARTAGVVGVVMAGVAQVVGLVAAVVPALVKAGRKGAAMGKASRDKGARGEQLKLRVVPLTLPAANRCVSVWHRHHAALPGGFAWFCVGVVADDCLVGAAIAGRPTNRNNDDRLTVEVLRVATDGTPNACSALLGACARAARAVGAARIITYTLTEESGTSLRGAGWRLECGNTGKSWWTHKGTRTPARERAHMGKQKARWGLTLNDPITYTEPKAPQSSTAQESLWVL